MNKKVSAPAVLIATGVLVALALLVASRAPLIADEPQFVDVAASLAAQAKPLGYSGSRWNVVLTHPTLYHSLVAIPVAVGGKMRQPARVVGIVAFLATAFLVYRTARAATGERWAGPVAAVLYLLHPFAFQSALLVEIDTGILPLAAALIAYYLGRIGFNLREGRWLPLGLLFGVALAAKLTTPALMVFALALFLFIRGRFNQLPYVALAAAAGGGFFALYFFPFTLLRDLPWQEPFLHSFTKAGATFAMGALTGRAVKVVLWFGIPFVLALAWALVSRARRSFRSGEDAAPVTDFALLTTWLLIVFYLFVGGEGYGFPKYHAPALPLAALALGATFGPQLGRESKVTVLVILGAALAYYVVFVRDPLYWPYMAREYAEVWMATYGEVRRAVVWAGLSVILPVIVTLATIKPRGWGVAFLLLAAASGPALIAWQVATPYNHRYNYGEQGFGTAARLAARVPEQLTIVVPVDVAFAEGYRHPHVAVEDALRSPGRFRAMLRRPDVAVVVLRDSYFLHDAYRPALEDDAAIKELETNFLLSRRGSFTVAVRKPPAQPESQPARR